MRRGRRSLRLTTASTLTGRASDAPGMKMMILIRKPNSSASRLAAGGVLECVDRVVEDEVGAAWAVVRPPGHHAEVRMKKLDFY